MFIRFQEGLIRRLPHPIAAGLRRVETLGTDRDYDQLVALGDAFETTCRYVFVCALVEQLTCSRMAMDQLEEIKAGLRQPSMGSWRELIAKLLKRPLPAERFFGQLPEWFEANDRLFFKLKNMRNDREHGARPQGAKAAKMTEAFCHGLDELLLGLAWLWKFDLVHVREARVYGQDTFRGRLEPLMGAEDNRRHWDCSWDGRLWEGHCFLLAEDHKAVLHLSPFVSTYDGELRPHQEVLLFSGLNREGSVAKFQNGLRDFEINQQDLGLAEFDSVSKLLDAKGRRVEPLKDLRFLLPEDARVLGESKLALESVYPGSCRRLEPESLGGSNQLTEVLAAPRPGRRRPSLKRILGLVYGLVALAAAGVVILVIVGTVEDALGFRHSLEITAGTQPVPMETAPAPTDPPPIVVPEVQPDRPVAEEAAKPRTATGPDRVWVPSGKYQLCCKGCEPWTGKGPRISEAAEVGPVRGFFIDRYEASDRRYNRCVEHGSCTPIRWKGCINWENVPADGKSKANRTRTPLDSRPGWYNGGEEPAICLDSAQAEAFCQWAGGRLPTEDEWTAAAEPADWDSWYPFDGWTAQRDDLGKPTGRRPKANLCGTECEFQDNRPNLTDYHQRLAPVTAYPEGESKAGARNMVGNVWEWAARCRPQNEPCLKGGAWNNTKEEETWRFATYRKPGHFVSAGIRCAYDR